MKKCLKKTLSGILAATMLFSSVTVSNVFAAPSFSQVGGWFESIYAEIPSIKDADVTGVSYSGATSGTLSGDDLTYLVRDMSGGVRIDVPGLKVGTYTLTVTTSSGTVTKDNIIVQEYDRSGYAHYNYTEGVGAYNDDGTVKANAKILYVTNENKDTVSVTSKDGTTVTGIGNILNSAGKDAGTGTTSKGGKPNTNAGIIGKLADDGTPLVVRIVGDVKAPAGVTAYDSVDYGGTVGDNGYMARMQGGKDVTIEGIGADSSINGWGIHFICDTVGYSKGNGKSFEVRNIKFQNVPEDCVGMEGQQEGSTITAGVERCWVHNCSFYAPSISNPAESDKSGGDGACDFKRGQYFTNSYCYYKGYHKTNLVGSSDSSLQFNLTYHHNYWQNCEARGPLGRQANIHMYNNYYEGQTDYAMNARANCYIFSEYNLFYMCKNPQRVDAGAIKSYNDSLSGCIEAMEAKVVTDKSTKVSSGCKYENFDTDSSLSYIPSNNYKLDTSIVSAKKNIMAYAGTMKENPVTAESVNTSIVLSDRQPTASVQLPYDKDLNSSYVTNKSGAIDNIVFNVGKTAVDSISTATDTNGQNIVFYVNEPVNISITDGGATYPVILLNDSGEAIITGTGTANNVPTGTYFIQSSGFQPGKSGSPAKFKEAKITHLSIVSAGSELPTIAEPTTSEPTTSDSSNPTEGTTSNQEPDTEETTSKPYDGEGLVWNYTSGENTLGVNFNGNDYTGSSVTYNGSTFTKAAKMESSTSIGFTAPGSGKLTIVSKSSKNPATIKVNGETVTISQDGATTIDVPAGAVNITKGTTSTYLYLLEFKGDSVETTTNVTTVTEATTEATTKAEATTEETTEETTVPEGVVVSVGSTTAKTGDKITVPVKLTGLNTLENYAVTVNYDSNVLTLSDVVSFVDSNNFVVNKNNAGVIKVAYANDNAGSDDSFNGDVLFSMTFTVKSENDTTSSINATVNQLNDGVTATVVNGTVTVDNAVTPVSIPGDVNKDGVVNSVDAAIVLKIASGIITDTTPYDMVAADCDGKFGVDGRDVIWILNHQTTDDNTSTTEATTEETTSKTEDTTKAEATTESTTTSPVVTDGLPAGSYDLTASVTDKIDTTNARDVSTAGIKLRSENYIEFVAGVSGKLTLTVSGKAAKLVSVANGAETEVALNSNSANVTAGTTYRIYGTESGSNTTITNLVLSSDGTVVEPTTQTTTNSEVTTSKTETTTKTSGGDATTETTTNDLSGAINISAGDSASLATALKNATAGTTINLAPGTYKMSAATSMSKSGTASKPITVTCANGMATLDYDGTSGRAITAKADYINFSNLTVKNGGDNGMYITGGHINVENCIFQANGDTGLQISGGGNNVLVKNCTSFDNLQTENADGFAAKLGAGENVVFDGCIAYCNSDDGWDLFSKSGDQQNKYPITLRNCIAFKNGQLTDGTVEKSGDRNGFKLGGGGYGAAHIVENCIAFDNGACGFTDNNNPSLAVLKNCTGYSNATADVKKHNFSIYRATEGIEVTNCLSYVLNADPNGDGKDRFDGSSSGTTYNANATVANSVFGCANKYYKIAGATNITATTQLATNGTEVTVSDSDFQTLELPYTDILKVHEQMRNADGSIKLNGFLQPKAGTDIEGMGAQFN